MAPDWMVDALPYLPAAGTALLVVVLSAVLLWRRGRRASWLEDSRERADLGREIGRLRRELVEASRRADQQLQVRLGELRELLVEADQRIAQLRRLVGNPAGPQQDQAQAPQWSAKREAVLRLHRQGLSAEQIAADARLDAGEVELILNLERASAQTGESARPGQPG